jgi:hypothetical protein
VSTHCPWVAPQGPLANHVSVLWARSRRGGGHVRRSHTSSGWFDGGVEHGLSSPT